MQPGRNGHRQNRRFFREDQSALINMYMENVRLAYRSIYETNQFIHNTERTLRYLLNANVPMSNNLVHLLQDTTQSPFFQNGMRTVPNQMNASASPYIPQHSYTQSQAPQQQYTNAQHHQHVHMEAPSEPQSPLRSYPESTTYTYPWMFNIPLSTTYVPRDPSGNRIRQQWMHSFLDNVPVVPTEAQIRNAVRDISYSSISDPIYTICPISMEAFNTDDTVSQIIHCGHIFGQQSLNQWFERNVRCPLCRYDIRDYVDASSVDASSASTVQNNIGNHEDNPEYFPPRNETQLMDLSSNVLRNILRPIARPTAARSSVRPTASTSALLRNLNSTGLDHLIETIATEFFQTASTDLSGNPLLNLVYEITLPIQNDEVD